MPNETISNENRTYGAVKFSLLLFIVMISVSSLLLACIVGNDGSISTIVTNENVIFPEASQPEGFQNITDFWGIEKLRVENTPLSLWMGETTQSTNNGILYNRTEISYQVPSWVNATESTYRINATLFCPTNSSGNLEPMPGIAAFHGLDGQRSNNYEIARESITTQELNCVFLCPDQPGHGESEGPEYEPNNWYYTEDFNKSSHNYLVICAGLQAIRVLESLSIVNNSELAVMGFSYGGLTSMWVSGIYSEKISLCMPSISCGGYEYVHNQSNFYDIMDKIPGTIDSYWKIQGQEVDPQYYLKTNNFPNICWFFGTNDEYFPIEGLNVSYLATTGAEEKWLQIHPNGHHGLDDWEDTTYFLIKNTFFDGPDAPQINIIRSQKHDGFILDNFEIDVQIDSEIAIEKVEICYDYRNIYGMPWDRTEIYKKDGESDVWTGKLDTPWLTSEANFFVIVTLDDGNNVWFTSQIYSAGILENKLSFLSIMALIIVFIVPIFIFLYKRYQDDVLNHSHLIYHQVRMNYIIETIGVSIGEFLIIVSLFMPWIDFGTLSWSHVFIVDHIGTDTDVFGNLAYYITPLMITFWTLTFLSTLANPLKGGIYNLAWPVGVQIFITVFSNMSGIELELGSGVVTFIIGSSIQIVFGIWQKYYRKLLHVPEKPWYHYFGRKSTRKQKKALKEKIITAAKKTEKFKSKF